MIEMNELCNKDVERSVIQKLAESETAYITACDLIEDNYFYDEKFKEIFLSIRKTHQVHKRCNVTLLHDTMVKSRPEIDSYEFMNFFSDLVVKSDGIEQEALILREYYLLRELHKLNLMTMEDIRKKKDYKSISEDIERKILELNDKTKEKNRPEIKEIISKMRMLDRDREEIKSIPVLDVKLQEYLPAYYAGHCIMIGGYTSVGKSTYLMQLVKEMCEAGASVLIFSTEDSQSEKTNKIISNYSNISQRNLMTWNISTFDREAYDEAMGIVNNFDLRIYDDVFSLESIRMKIKRGKMQGKVDIVCLDYIQGLSLRGSIYEQMSHAIHELYRMARELDVCMVVLSQVSNESMRNEDSKMIGLKGAGELSSVPDMVIELKRGNEDSEKGNELQYLKARVRKNRKFGSVGKMVYEFNNRFTRLDHAKSKDDYQLSRTERG